MERFSRSLYYALTTIDIRKMIEDIISKGGFLKEVSYSDIENTPTTLAGYGITDAYILNGTIYLGNQSITPESVSNLGTAAYCNYITSIIQNSNDLPTSGAVYSAIAAAVSSALHFRGISTTALTDGGTETATIGGVALVPQDGDVVIYNGFEFLWESNCWNKLGDDTSYALKTIQITGDGTYITGGGDLTASRTLDLSQATKDALALAATAYQKPANGIPDSDLETAYLPLTAGSSKALSGDLYIDAISASKNIRWTYSGNTTARAMTLLGDGGIYLGTDQITNGKATHIFGANIYLKWNTTAATKSIVFDNSSVRPATTGLGIQLGQVSYPFANVYADNLYGNLALSYLTGADDLKAIEALTETSGFLKKTAANTWALTNDIEASSLKTTTESKAEFTFRATPSVAIGDSAIIKKIYGRTLVWNQLVNGTFTNAATWALNGVTLSVSNNIGTITASSAGGRSIYQTLINGVVGHKYYVAATIKGSVSMNCGCGYSGNNRTNIWSTGTTFSRFSKILTGTTTAKEFYIYMVAANAGDSIDVKDVICIDLTKLGLDNLSESEFEALFPLLYYDKNSSGSFLNLTATGLVTNGFNQWDEVWEVGGIETVQGTNTTTSGYTRSKNYIPIFSQTAYYIKSPVQMNILFYGADMKYLGNGYTLYNKKDTVFNTPSIAHFLRFRNTNANEWSTYQNDICINLSDTAKNGTYEPYWEDDVPLNITTLKVKSPNIWDEEWKFGYYENGVFVSSANNICSKSHIPCIPSSTYYFKTAGVNMFVTFYDGSGTYISGVYTGGSPQLGTQVKDATITTPTNAYYMTFNLGAAYGTTYNNDICLNLSNPGYNGHYYPHGEFAPYADGMKQAGTASDELWQTGTRRKMAKVDLGTLTYILYSSANHTFRCTIPGKKKAEGNCICSNYVQSSVSKDAMADKEMQGIAGYEYLYIRDTAYSDATAFQAAMSGVYLIYEQANPEDFELVTPLPTMFKSDVLGTQTLLPENTSTPTTAPLVADFQYGSNAGDMVDDTEARLSEIGHRLDTFGFANLSEHPTTISGYGITDAYTKTEGDGRYLLLTGNTTQTKITGNIILGNNVFLQGLHTDGTSKRTLIGEDSHNTVIVGNASQALYLITANTSNLIHQKGGVNYSVYDSSNLTKSVLTTLLESASGYYLPLTAGSGKALTGSFYTQSIVPSSNNAYDLGTSSAKFKDLYLAGTLTADSGSFASSLLIPTLNSQTIGDVTTQWYSADSSLWVDTTDNKLKITLNGTTYYVTLST